MSTGATDLALQERETLNFKRYLTLEHRQTGNPKRQRASLERIKALEDRVRVLEMQFSWEGLFA